MPGKRFAVVSPANMVRHSLASLALMLLAILLPTGAEAQTLRGHRLPPQCLQRYAGVPASDRVLHLVLGLPARGDLPAFLRDLYDPSSSTFRHFIRPEEFAARFGLSVPDYAALVAFTEAQGFLVTKRDRSRLMLHLTGTVAQVERAFRLHLNQYQRDDGSLFMAPDSEPQIDLPWPDLHVSGLDDYGLHVIHTGPGVGWAQAGSGLPCKGVNSYLGADLREAYAPGVTLTGAGQTVALVEFDDYYDSDISAYALSAGQSVPTLTRIQVDSPLGAPACGNPEVCLDIEMVMAMAPQAVIVVYEEGPLYNVWPYCFTTSPVVDILARIADDDTAQQISCSWGWNGYDDPNQQTVFAQYAAQGQTFFNASGDSGALCPEGPYSTPFQPLMETTFITVVGGTTLSTGPGGTYASETTWNDSLVHTTPAAVATLVATPYPNLVSSGGICGGFQALAIPTYQANVFNSLNGASASDRNIPDVSMAASQLFVAFNHGLTSPCGGGTSAAAPLWAGFMALVNEQASTLGRPSIGMINPTLYSLAADPAAYAADFNDIADGSDNNYWETNPSRYQAVEGYDLCTGLGSPRAALINDLIAKTTPRPTATPLPPPLGPNDILAAVAIPNPSPKALAVELAGAGDQIECQVFSQAFTLVSAFKITQPLVKGWNTLQLPAAWAKDLRRQVYFIRLTSVQAGGRKTFNKAVRVYWLG